MNRIFKNGVSIIMALAMLICQCTAFAAGNENAETETKTSVPATVENYLKGFGVFSDSEVIDDTVVTRAEAADRFVRATGFNYDTVGKTGTFSDVSEGTTAQKASEAALLLGIVIRNDENMFYPDRALSRNEAIIMAVRTMRAESVATLKGGYPDGYLTVARDTQLMNNTSGSDQVTRSDLAYIVYNMLNANVYDVTYSSDKASYKINPDVTVVENLRNIKKYSVEFVNTYLAEKQVEVTFTSGDKKGMTEKYSVADNIDISRTVGKGYAYISADTDEIVYIELKKDSTVLYDYVRTVNNSYNKTNLIVKDIEKMSFANDETTYKTDKDLVVYFNDKKVEAEANSYIGCFTKAVVQDGKITRLDIYEVKHGGQVLYSVHDTLRFRRAEEEREWTDIDEIKSLEIFIDGISTPSMLDIKGNMIFDFWRDEDNDKLMLVVSSRVAKGKVTGRAAENKIVIDGVKYELSDDVATFNKQADEYRPGLDYDYIQGQNVAAYFADDRTIRYIRIDAVNTLTNVVRGVITKAYVEENEDKYIKVFHIDDALGEVNYKVAKKLNKNSLSFEYAYDVQKNYEGAGFLQFTLNDNGEIKNIQPVDYFGYEQNMTEHNVPDEGVVCGQYCKEAQWFAILNIDGKFTVRKVTYDNMKYMHKDGGGLRIISDFNSRYNPTPQYFMLLGWENAATAFGATSFISRIDYVDPDTSKIVLVGNTTFNVSNEFIEANDLKENDLITYRSSKTSKEPLSIVAHRTMAPDSSDWTYDAWSPASNAGFYKADDVAYYNDAAIQFIVNGEYTDAYRFTDNGANAGNMTPVYRYENGTFTRALMNFGYQVNYAREYRGASTMNLTKGDNIWFALSSDRTVAYIIYESNGNNYDD